MDAEPWPWPDSLDAAQAAAETHKVLFENDAVRVLETKISPGETTELHTHRWPGVFYVLSAAHFVRRDGDGVVTFDTRDGVLPEPGSAFWNGALSPHTLENVDTSDAHVIAFELKSG